MNRTSTAPRLRASMPTAPVPAKASTKREPLTRSPRTLNRVSRSRSLVGRSARPLRLFKMRLRYFPAMTRMDAIVSYQFLVFSQAGRRITPPRRSSKASKRQQASALQTELSPLSPNDIAAAIRRGVLARRAAKLQSAPDRRRAQRLRGGLAREARGRAADWRFGNRGRRTGGGREKKPGRARPHTVCGGFRTLGGAPQ